MAHDPKRPKDLLDWLKVSNAPDWRVARTMGPIIAVALGLLFALALLAAFLIVGAAIGTPESAGFGTGAVIVALLGAPFLIWRTVIAQTTLGYQKEGHITDRINKAVEMLGAEKEVKRAGDEETVPNIEVRMGAILSLERIAQDSTRFDKGRDHVRVMEILCAYIRENSNAQPPKDFPEPEKGPASDKATEGAHAASPEHKREYAEVSFLQSRAWQLRRELPAPRADVQQALKVIGRRNAEQRKVEAAWPNPPAETTRWPFDTACPRLSDASGEKHRSTAEPDAYRKELSAWLARIVDYRGYVLDLRGANLQGIDMTAKQPDGSDAVFAGARLVGARMEAANVRGARMEGANLLGGRMEGADLKCAHMEGAALMAASLNGTDLREARLEGADLSSVRFDAATSLTAAAFACAALRKTDLSQTTLSDDQLRSAFGDGSVTLPKGITTEHPDWPAHWPRWELPLFNPDGDTNFFAQWRKWLDNPDTYTPPEPPE